MKRARADCRSICERVTYPWGPCAGGGWGAGGAHLLVGLGGWWDVGWAIGHREHAHESRCCCCDWP